MIAITASAEAPTVRWDVDASGRGTSVTVLGLPSSQLKSTDRWAEILTVQLDGVDKPGMLGAYRVEDGTLRFVPEYPLDKGRRYRATFRPSKLGGEGPDVTSIHLVPKPDRPPTVVARVDPSPDRLPENLLKFYIHFSAPMSRGEAYEHLKLTRDDGKVVDRPFLELIEELWDPTSTRLTVLIDPGRIKRGLQPREQFGPVLEAGHTYTLSIDPAWRDGEGDPLVAATRKTFLALPADDVQPDPKTWTMTRPIAGTRDPLILTFPEPLDRALLESAMILLDAKDQAVSGKLAVEAGQTRWRFTPEQPWTVGNLSLQVDTELEDLAGNSIRRPFEIDIQRDTPARPEVHHVRLPVKIEASGQPTSGNRRPS